ncbi:hypothetical protein DB42_BL00370 [Neochlamydia sp. EPS4]|nr:hypothetical protein DB42_BL00370 [Neochlamydia sp. EPS4]
MSGLMPKTNFTKVEESLIQGLDKLNIKKIIDSTSKDINEKRALDETRINKRKTAIYMISELKRLHKNDERIYLKLGTNLSHIKKMLEHPLKLNAEEWGNVLKLLDKIEAYKRAFAQTIKEVNNEEMVEKERKKQSDKRFNIQEKWLPID